jgi:Mrp family chromosome partitioning ATPase
MSEENCDHNCEACGEEGCKSRKIEKLKPHPETKIRKTIAIVSGKGGVGKTMVTSLLGAELSKKGHSVAIMDADVTGPSIPQAFGIKGQATGDENGIFAMKTKHDLRLMSVNCLLDNASDPVLWRGPLIANLVGQLYTNVIYGEVEYLLIDMPPGTGDVPLTVFQQIPVDGVIIVASPQELVSMIVEKAVNMCKMMKIPLLGLVENMAYVQCPHCGEKIKIYGDDKSAEVAKRYGIPLLDELPIDPILASATDKGEIEEVEKTFLPKAVEKIIKL